MTVRFSRTIVRQRCYGIGAALVRDPPRLIPLESTFDSWRCYQVTHTCPKCNGPATPIIGQYVACKRCDAPAPPRPVSSYKCVGAYYLPQRKPLRTPEAEVIDWVDRSASLLGWSKLEVYRDPMLSLRVGARCSRCGDHREMDCPIEFDSDVRDIIQGIKWAMRHSQCAGRP